MKKLISITLVLTMLFSLCTLDVSAKETDYAVQFLKSLGIVKGDENGNMNLYDNVTRAEFAKMTIASSSYRNSVATSSYISPFPDVKYSYWGSSYIKTAVDAGYINGYPDSTFKPENNVLLEEGVTICLKLLGYTDSDFPGVWPQGQMAKANELELIDNVTTKLGESMKRIDVMNLIYNTLSCKSKSGTMLISSFNYTCYEDTVLIATSDVDSSVPHNKVVTTNGTFTINEDFDKNLSGRKGTLIVKNDSSKGNVVFSFIPESQEVESYTLNTIIDNSILVYSGNVSSTIELENDTVIYYKSSQKAIESVKSAATFGDIVKVYKDSDGSIEYITIGSGVIGGPYILSSAESVYNLGADSSTQYYRNGRTSSVSELQTNDVIYYSKEINAIWAYSDKIAGVYENATPTKDNIKSITVSGKTYEIETATAYAKLVTGGKYNFGDSVVLLLGRNGKVADVISSVNTTIYGYVTKASLKSYTYTSGEIYTSNYVEIMTADGSFFEYKVNKDYSSYLSSICSVKVTNGVANLNKVNTGNTGIYGTFTYGNMMIGSASLAPDVKILDVMTTKSEETPAAVTSYPQRLDGCYISSTDVLYYTKNSDGKIDTLFLNDCTGDGYTYGVVSDVTYNQGSTSKKPSSYTVFTKDNTYTTNIAKLFSVGDAVRVYTTGGKISRIYPMIKISEKITEFDYDSLETSKATYKISGDVNVYKEVRTNNDVQYYIAAISDVFESDSVKAFYSSADDKLVRVLIIN